MTDENLDKAGISVSVPVGIVAALAVGLIALTAAYLIAGREDGTTEANKGKAKSGKSLSRRMGLTALITMIENDTSRKLVLAVLRAMARRA